MRILLTNDDGIDAEGIKVLREAFAGAGHEVCTVAPLGNRSGASCSLSVGIPLELVRAGENSWALDGSPVDCVVSALKSDYLPWKPDAVFSGINNEYNLGTDIIYSGTCGAARQASLFGVPGIALSIESIKIDEKKCWNYKGLSEFAVKNIKKLIGLCQNNRNLKEGKGCAYFVNVNAPSADSYGEAKIASLSRRDYGDKALVTQDSSNKMYSTCVGSDTVVSEGDEFSDTELVKHGIVAVSVLPSELVAESELYGRMF